MAHFAELDDNNTVLRVTVVSNADLLDENGVEQEALGIAVCEQQLGGRWVQTSYNGNFRKRYAGIGYIYDPAFDVFLPPKPYPSWAVNADGDWEAPTPQPEGNYTWDEPSLTWIQVAEE